MIISYILMILSFTFLLLNGLQGFFGFSIYKAAHIPFAFFSTIFYMFTQTLIMFYFIGAGKKIKETNFRQTYGATVLAVHRYNEELSGRIGEITLRSGDLLIVVPHDKLPDNMKTDFYLLSNNFRESKPKKTKTILGIGIGAILSCLTLGFIDLF